MAKKEQNEEQVREKFMQFQMLQKQIEQVTEHLQALAQQQTELEISKKAVAEIGDTKVDNEILAPVANGIFIKAELKDNQKLIVNVGSDVTVEKTVKQVVELLDEQKQKMTESIAEVNEYVEKLQQQAMIIYKEVEMYIQED